MKLKVLLKNSAIKSYIEDYLNDLEERGLYRKLKKLEDGFLDFSSNDYLGLSHNKDSIAAGFESAKVYGAGSTGSRLLSGNKEIFEKFEHQISLDKNFESSLIFNSGFVANASVISAFSIPGTILIFDRLNHSSMYYGANLSKVKLLRYKHLDYNELENILKKCDSYKNKILASETVFGMDGDIADIKTLSYLSQKYGTLLYLDEAHATGLYGKNGYGIATDFELDQSSIIVMGTFSKALSSSGAYVACSNIIKEYLIQKSKSFIYSTALSPFCIGVAMYNWNLLKKLDKVREHIIKSSDSLRKEISRFGYNVVGSCTNIIPIIFEDIKDMLSLNAKLLENKIIASPIRRPTSPTSRIRLAVNAKHSRENLDSLLKTLKK